MNPEPHADTVRVAYADPPYLGVCGRYEHRHEEPYGCWDDPATHALLIEHLGEFDGWALSAGSSSLQTLLPMCPKAVRIAVWVKPWAPFNSANPAYAWEPVIYKPGRYINPRRGPMADRPLHVRDWLAECATTQRSVIGAKPGRFCAWVLDLLGYRDGDDLIDIFPGSGVMGRVAAQGRLAI